MPTRCAFILSSRWQWLQVQIGAALFVCFVFISPFSFFFFLFSFSFSFSFAFSFFFFVFLFLSLFLSLSVFHINTRSHALYAVIFCKFIVVKMRGGNLALARAAEMMLLASLFTVQVTSRCSVPVVVCFVTRHTLHLNIN
jgi:hypothetical protein